MTDTTKFGPWVRRFLLEHLVSERNLARNTQRSYRDTLAYSSRSSPVRCTSKSIGSTSVMSALRTCGNSFKTWSRRVGAA